MSIKIDDFEELLELARATARASKVTNVLLLGQAMNLNPNEPLALKKIKEYLEPLDRNVNGHE